MSYCDPLQSGTFTQDVLLHWIPAQPPMPSEAHVYAKRRPFPQEVDENET